MQGTLRCHPVSRLLRSPMELPGTIAVGLCFGIWVKPRCPGSERGRPWVWTEWEGAAVTLSPLLLWTPVPQGKFQFPETWARNLLIHPVWPQRALCRQAQEERDGGLQAQQDSSGLFMCLGTRAPPRRIQIQAISAGPAPSPDHASGPQHMFWNQPEGPEPQHHLGTSKKCKFLDPGPDPLHENFWRRSELCGLTSQPGNPDGRH